MAPSGPPFTFEEGITINRLSVLEGVYSLFSGEHSMSCRLDTALMAEFHRAGHERVHVFLVDELYLFKHYFDGDEVFDRLKQYYNNQQYRFEVPPSDFEDLQEFLDSHGYALIVVDQLDEFVVVVRKYTAHPGNIFKESVIHRSANEFNCFLMTDRDAVERAVREGASRLSSVSLESPF